jgi:hypothetical protein
LFERSHDDGYCAVIGGYEYHGTAIANLDGAYVYGDLCRTTLSGAVQSGGVVTDELDFGVGASNITTFGEDHNGELYFANLSGFIYKLVPGAPPTISVGDKAILEGDAATRQLTFPVTLSDPATTTQTVQYMVAGTGATGGTKPGNGVDFKFKSGTVTFAPNATGKTPISKMISVTVYGETTAESSETLSVTLSAPQGGYSLGRPVGQGTILNDDGIASGTTAGIGDAAIRQARSGSQTLAIPLTLSAKVASQVSVNYTVTPGTATYSAKRTGGGDFGGKLSGTIAFAANTTIRNISIPIWPDVVPDTDHTFTITLSGLTGSGVTLIRSGATVRILDS